MRQLEWVLRGETGCQEIFYRETEGTTRRTFNFNRALLRQDAAGRWQARIWTSGIRVFPEGFEVMATFDTREEAQAYCETLVHLGEDTGP